MSRILITGAAGLVGQALLAELPPPRDVIATDIREPDKLCGSRYVRLDVTGEDPMQVLTELKPEVVVHLASIVAPPKGSTREFEYNVDVKGTKAILEACIANNVRRLVVTSSGAAYGYHADNPNPLRESDVLRGNKEFPYSHHKRLVEELLAEARKSHPKLQQVVLRVGTVLGTGVNNQITALFQKSRLLAIRGSDSPFVFIWTQDLARILLRAATDGPTGIFNCAGDGSMNIADIAKAQGKNCITLPAWVLKLVLLIARPLRLSRYGPEQVRFLQYRPVLDNSALKSIFGYSPEFSSVEAFELWRRGNDS